MPSTSRDTSYSELLRSLLADERRFRQALRSTPAVMPSPSLTTSCSKFLRLLVADVRRLRRVRSELLMLLVADARRFRKLLGSELLKLLSYDASRLKQLVGFAPALNLELEGMGFFEAGPESFNPIEWRYAIHFPHETTRYIKCMVAVRRVHRQRDRRYSLVHRCYMPDGSLLDERRTEWMIKGKFYRDWIVRGWGWPDPGLWTPGAYLVQILIDGVEVAKSAFIIEPPKPPAENLHLISVRFYAAGASQKEARQHSVRFPHRSTREVICELTVQNLLYQQRNQTYDMTAQCYTAEEKLLWEDHHDWVIKSEEQEPSITWGWKAPGQWSMGAYRVEILVGGAEFAWGAFLIE